MVNLQIVRTSNATLQSRPPGLVAVFAGATAGVGLSTLRALAKNANAPRAYIIGRSAAKASLIINELKTINPGGTFVFLEAQVALIHDVDRVCKEIKKMETYIDILCMSPGYLSLAKKHETFEGIEASTTLQYYARQRLISNLIPLLELSTAPRVISILGAGFEGPVTSSDLTLDHSTLSQHNPIQSTRTAITMTTLMFEQLAALHPSISFIHSWPGNVGSPLFDHLLATTPGLLWYPAQVTRYTFLPFYAHFFSTSPEEAGERTLFLATSGRYPAAKVHELKGKIEGLVDRPHMIPSAHATVSVEGKGNGVYRTDSKGESYTPSKVLDDCRDQGMGRKVFEHTHDVWQKALSAAEEARQILASTPSRDRDSLNFEPPTV